MPRENEGKASLQKNFRRRHEREQHFELQSALVDKILFREVWKSKLWIETWWQSLHLLWNTRIKVSNFDHQKKVDCNQSIWKKGHFFRFLKKYLEKSTFLPSSILSTLDIPWGVAGSQCVFECVIRQYLQMGMTSELGHKNAPERFWMERQKTKESFDYWGIHRQEAVVKAKGEKTLIQSRKLPRRKEKG